MMGSGAHQVDLRLRRKYKVWVDSSSPPLTATERASALEAHAVSAELDRLQTYVTLVHGMFQRRSLASRTSSGRPIISRAGSTAHVLLPRNRW